MIVVDSSALVAILEEASEADHFFQIFREVSGASRAVQQSR